MRITRPRRGGEQTRGPTGKETSGEILTARQVLRQQVAKHANHKSRSHFGGKGLGLEEVEVLGPVALRQAATVAVAVAAAPAAKTDATAHNTMPSTARVRTHRQPLARSGAKAHTRRGRRSPWTGAAG